MLSHSLSSHHEPALKGVKYYSLCYFRVDCFVWDCQHFVKVWIWIEVNKYCIKFPNYMKTAQLMFQRRVLASHAFLVL